MSSSSSSRSGGATLGVVRFLVLAVLFAAVVLGGAAVYIGGYQLAGVLVVIVGAVALGAVSQRRG